MSEEKRFYRTKMEYDLQMDLPVLVAGSRAERKLNEKLAALYNGIIQYEPKSDREWSERFEAETEAYVALAKLERMMLGMARKEVVERAEAEYREAVKAQILYIPRLELQGYLLALGEYELKKLDEWLEAG